MALGLAMVVLLAGRVAGEGAARDAGRACGSRAWAPISSAPTSRFTFGQRWSCSAASTSSSSRSACSRSARCSATWSRARRRRCCRCRRGCATCCRRWQDLKDCRFAFVNGSVVGFLIGVLPGAGSTIASFISYGIEKAVSKHPEKFGTGVPEGVAAPEGANNAETGGALVPLLTLGIPGIGDHRDPARRADPVGLQARAAVHPGATRRCSGAWSRACTSATSCCSCSTCRWCRCSRSSCALPALRAATR